MGAIEMKITAERRPGFDLLSVPLVGRFLRWKHARSTMQVPMLLLSAVLLYDGFFGPQLAPKNVAGVAPWVHWRGFVVLALLIAGNLFCMACPFMLPRRLAKRLLPGDRAWPRALRSKWLAAGLLLLFFWSYEAFDLWASPWLTAWVALTYFAGAFVVDGFFKGAAFCKYVCPIGQFNFVNSLVSPLEVRVREPAACAGCVTKDCIKGRYERPGPGRRRIPLTLASGPAKGAAAAPPRGTLVQSGCELWLFQERKEGNMDCTFCLDCVQACPHDNVGILRRPLTSELWDDPRRSGVGYLGRRPDLAALALVVVFGALLNALGMVGPGYELEAWLSRLLGTRSEPVLLAVVFALGLVVLPLAAVGLASLITKALTGATDSPAAIGTRHSYALVPVGFGMWAAHYSYHFLTGALTIVPVLQGFAADLGFPVLGEPAWGLGQVVPTSWLVPIEIMLLQLGLAGSLLVAHKIARREHPDPSVARRAFLPWAALIFGVFVAGVWLMLQPMEMRGTFGSG